MGLGRGSRASRRATLIESVCLSNNTELTSILQMGKLRQVTANTWQSCHLNLMPVPHVLPGYLVASQKPWSRFSQIPTTSLLQTVSLKFRNRCVPFGQFWNQPLGGDTIRRWLRLPPLGGWEWWSLLGLPCAGCFSPYLLSFSKKSGKEILSYFLEKDVDELPTIIQLVVEVGMESRCVCL